MAKRKSPTYCNPDRQVPMKDVPGYNSWRAMRQRCLNPNAHNYAWYGGRGVGLCERWKKSFDAFIADMGVRPSPKHSIERLNNERGYEPGNCIRASALDQARNRSSSAKIEIGGEQHLAIDLAKEHGLKSHTVRTRAQRGKVGKELFSPAKADLRFTVPVDYDGEVVHLAEAARRAGISPETLAGRIRRGYPRELWFRQGRIHQSEIPSKGPLPKGVRLFRNGRYQARVQWNKKTFHIGYFDTPAEAEAAQKAKVDELKRDAGVGVPK